MPVTSMEVTVRTIVNMGRQWTLSVTKATTRRTASAAFPTVSFIDIFLMLRLVEFKEKNLQTMKRRITRHRGINKFG